MTVVRMPGRHGRSQNGGARIDTRNCFMSDAEAAERERRVMAFEAVEREHNFPAFVWWLVVSVASVGSFVAGVFLGLRA